MNTSRFRIAIAALCLAGLIVVQAFAQDAPTTRLDPRAHEDLNQVIMLCATEPTSERFAAAWLDWIERNPEADIYAAVNTVVSRAGTFRSMAIPGMEPISQGRRPDPEGVAEYMLNLVGQPPVLR